MMNENKKTLILLQGIGKIYNKGKPAQFEALKNISLEIREGEMVALMGKSGSGKSTLLHILGFADTYNSGIYEFAGQDMSYVSKGRLANLRNEKIGFVMQDFALIPQMSVADNIGVPLYIRHLRNKDIKEQIKRAAAGMGIEELLKKKVSQLSGGQCQRVAIARAVIANPQVILADEPTGALDKANGERVLKLLREINSNGTTVLITTHDKDIARMCDRIITLEDGRILEEPIIYG